MAAATEPMPLAVSWQMLPADRYDVRTTAVRSVPLEPISNHKITARALDRSHHQVVATLRSRFEAVHADASSEPAISYAAKKHERPAMPADFTRRALIATRDRYTEAPGERQVMLLALSAPKTQPQLAEHSLGRSARPHASANRQLRRKTYRFRLFDGTSHKCAVPRIS